MSHDTALRSMMSEEKAERIARANRHSEEDGWSYVVAWQGYNMRFGDRFAVEVFDADGNPVGWL